MSQFNLSAWALRNKTVVLYTMIVLPRKSASKSATGSKRN
jgi:hypothetical protein